MKKKQLKKTKPKERIFSQSVPLELVKSERGRSVINWCFQIALVLALAAVFSIFFFQSITMQESSMEPTIKTGEKFFINKVAYKLAKPQRGDIIAFTKDGSDHAAVHIKRVVGLPGETVQIKDGKLYINGEELKEGNDLPQITNPGLAADPITLKKDEYFVLGDNRNNSEDSRFAEVKNVNKRYIEGKLWFCISPFEKIGFLDHEIK